KDRDKTEKLVLSELKRLQDELVSPAELKRVERDLIASSIFGRESVQSLADSIARGVTTNDLDYLKNYLSRLQAVTAKDVQAAARKYIRPEQRVVVWSVPPQGQKTLGAKAPEGSRPAFRNLPTASSNFSLKETQRVELPNGLTLLLFE